MQLKRRKKLRPTIPLSSMADIAFLLLIFFIVTSVLRFKDESTVEIPSVPKVETIDQKDREDLWIKSDGSLILRNKVSSELEVRIFFVQQAKINPNMVVFINGDARGLFQNVEKAINLLTQAGARKVVFVSKKRKQK